MLSCLFHIFVISQFIFFITWVSQVKVAGWYKNTKVNDHKPNGGKQVFTYMDELNIDNIYFYIWYGKKQQKRKT